MAFAGFPIPRAVYDNSGGDVQYFPAESGSATATDLNIVALTALEAWLTVYDAPAVGVGSTLDVRVDGSVDGEVWTPLATFTQIDLNAFTVPVVEIEAISGAVPPFLRYFVDIDGTTAPDEVEFSVALVTNNS